MKVELFKEHENTTGRMLIRAIKAGCKKQVSVALDSARKELATPNMKKSADEDYELMTQKMTAYLTRKYDVGDGMLFKKTPIEFAEAMNAPDIVEFINDTLIKLSQTKEVKHINLDKAPGIQAAVGTIDQDRVALAKSRLLALRNKEKS